MMKRKCCRVLRMVGGVPPSKVISPQHSESKNDTTVTTVVQNITCTYRTSQKPVSRFLSEKYCNDSKAKPQSRRVASRHHLVLSLNLAAIDDSRRTHLKDT